MVILCGRVGSIKKALVLAKHGATGRRIWALDPDYWVSQRVSTFYTKRKAVGTEF